MIQKGSLCVEVEHMRPNRGPLCRVVSGSKELLKRAMIKQRAQSLRFITRD